MAKIGKHSTTRHVIMAWMYHSSSSLACPVIWGRWYTGMSYCHGSVNCHLSDGKIDHLCETSKSGLIFTEVEEGGCVGIGGHQHISLKGATPQVYLIVLVFLTIWKKTFFSGCLKYGAYCKTCIVLFMLTYQFLWQPSTWPPF